MIDGFSYCYPGDEQRVWCITRDGARRTLCGQRVGFTPVVQPEHPTEVHRDCLEAMYWRAKPQPAAARMEYAQCPACQGDAPVFEGRIQAHGAWVRSAIGQRYQSEQACLGVNMRAVTRKRGGR